MNAALYLPAGVLSPYIKAYRIIESQQEAVNRILPDTSFAFAFRFRGKISYVHDNNITPLPIALCSGLRKSVRLIRYDAQTSAFIVQFRETGVRAFFKQPLQELFEESISLDHFFPGPEISIMEERLAEAKNNHERIALVENFLKSKLLDGKPDTLVSAAIGKLYAMNGRMRITELANGLCISQDALEKRFRKATGATPKQFSSIIKMKGIIRQGREANSFLDMALGFGYYDQAHFNKEFKIFTGQIPSEFFKSASYW